jgi:formamidopyrimidine-DNA glycosylase
MPELPEVETIKQQLDSLITGKRISSIAIQSPKSFIGDPVRVYGQKITALHRYAKLLVISLSNVNLGVHLKMTGQLLVGDAIQEAHHKRVVITFDDSSNLVFNDIRKFGWIKILTNEELNFYRKKLGPDPFDVPPDNFIKILKKSNKPVKVLLMDQDKIGGVGNIYANEALFLSKIDPRVKASSLTKKRSISLLESLITVLNLGVKYRGASRTNYRDIYGKKGSVQNHFQVYDQAGKSCPNKCGKTIKRIVIGGRSTFFCPYCQK